MFDPELVIRSAHERGDLQLAATVAMRRYGPDVLRFLRARLRSTTQAEDAYLQFAEDFWQSLQRFRWECPVRVWMFVLARAAATHLTRTPHYKYERLDPPGSEAYWQDVHTVRTGTALHLRSEVKSHIRLLREQLDDDEQTLLILRVDRGLAWRELAVVMGEVSGDAREDALARAAARMRTRFQAAKKRLRQMAEREGLTTPG